MKNNDKRANFLTLGKGDISTKKNEDGSISVIVSDNYDFKHMDKNDKYNIFKSIIKDINNTANRQQEKGKIQQYPIGFEIKYTPEEIENLMKLYLFSM